MALARRSGGRQEVNTWPGFVDAMTALLMILMFVLSIFMIIQFTMHEKLTGQTRELDKLTLQLADLADVLALERDRSAGLAGQVGELEATIAGQRTEVDRLGAALAAMTRQADASRAEADRLNAAMAALARSRDAALARSGELEQSLAESVSEREALQAALASTRSEMDAAVENARLAAARREAIEAMIAEMEQKDREREAAMATVSAERATALALIDQLRAERAASEQSLAERERALAEAAARLTEEETARLAEMAAAQALREKLAGSDAELDAMTLALEKARKEAEDTLILLAAAEAAKKQAEDQLAGGSAELDREATLRRLAEEQLASAEAQTVEEQKRVALLNAQVRELREQLAGLETLLGKAEQKDQESQIQIAKLGERLNQALAQKVGELARFRSVFFEKMEQVLGGRQDIQRVGDRFVFQSEVLFAAGSAELGADGQAQLAKLGAVLREIIGEVPADVAWILRVDGHTDRVPLGSGRRYRDNWELSQGRALSVVKYLIEQEQIPPERLAATGFGEFQPVDTGDTPEALAKNRRIEFKFTER